MDSIATQAAQIVSPSAGGIAFGNASRNFDGNDRISASSMALGTGDFSIAFWFKTTDSSFGYTISEGGATTSSVRGFGCALNNGAAYGFIHDGTRLVFSGIGSGFNDGVWHHRVDTFDRDGNWSCHIDNSLIGSQSISARSGSISGGRPLYFGFLDSGSSYWRGYAADLRIYNTVLSAGDISALGAGTHVSTNLIGWWLLNTDDVLDYSGNGNDGTNDGSTYSTDGPLDL